MADIKISSLGILDEQKFIKLASDREDWLNSGEDMLLNPNYETNQLALSLKPEQLVLSVKKVLQENDSYKTIVLNSLNGEALPIFRAGQKIAVTLAIKDKYYTEDYTIICSPSRALDGEYRITVKNESDSILSSYLFNKVKLGEKVNVSVPFGDFYYNSIRDHKDIIAIVCDKGIMPIYSMVQSIIDGTNDFNLTIFYNEKYESDLLFKEELLEYAEKTNKIKIKFVLSEEEKENYLTGYVSLDKIIRELRSGSNTTFFISGTEGMLKYLDKEIEELKLPKKFIRYESFLPVCNIKRIVKYTLTIYINDEKFEIPCYNNKTIMQSILDGGVYIPSKCHNGSCGYCRSELVFGEVKVINDKRTSSDKKYNYIHPCSTYPLSDIEIIVR